MSTERVRLGVVGCGAVAERYHLPALLASPEVEIVAFVDASIERARRLAARAGAPLALSSHRDLDGRVDAALVALPNALHEQVSIDLLQAGVHVLVEKPMARSVEECDRMLAAAAAAGAVLAVGHDFRHFPIARRVHELFAAGLMGAVRCVDIRQGAGSRWPSVGAEALVPAAGGGVLLTFGVHMLDLLSWWLGPLRVVRYRDDAVGGVEAECDCELELESGAPAHLELSRRRGMRDTAVIECERGTLEIGIYDPALLRVTLDAAQPPLIGTVPDPEFDQAPMRTVFARQLADFVGAVRGERAPLVSGHAGRAAVAAVEACYSIRQPLRRPWDYPEAYLSVGRA